METQYIGHSTEFSIGYFGGGGGGGTGDNLPPFSIELLSFGGYNDNVSNRLFWTTEMELNITIYPNPAQNELFISGNFAANAKVSISNMLGQEVLKMNLDMNNQTTVPLGSISQGVYMLNILNERNAIIHSEKLMKD